MVPSKAALCLALLSCIGLAAAVTTVPATEPNLQAIPISGKAANKTATGVYSISYFKAGTGDLANHIISVGHLTVVQNGMTMTSIISWPLASPLANHKAGRKLLAAGDCNKVLDLVLGPLNLNLLGLVVNLNQVLLSITPNATLGLLGSLLCAVTGLNILGQLNALTTILGILGL